MVNETRKGRVRIIGGANGVANAGWFGDSRHGDLIVPENTKHYFDVTADAGQVVKYYRNGYIGPGAEVTTSSRCCGCVLCFSGDLEIHGHLHMDARAPLKNNAEAQNVLERHVALISKLYKAGGDAGAAGLSEHFDLVSGARTQLKSGGKPGVGFQFGGGFGPGSGSNDMIGGDGEPRASLDVVIPFRDTFYKVGGQVQYGAGGNALKYSSTTSPDTVIYGGKGYGGSGAVEAYYSSASTCTAGKDGEAIGGGMLLIFVKGKLTISSDAVISADGGDGADGVHAARTPVHVVSGGGGGAGGGIIVIVHSGDYTTDGSVHANGGHGGRRPVTESFVVGSAGADGVNGVAEFHALTDLLAI